MSLTATIDDPRDTGRWSRPELYVVIEDELKSTDHRKIDQPDGFFYVEQFGPFHFYQFHDIDGTVVDDIDVGELNKALPYDEERFVEVIVNTPTQSHEMVMRRDRVNRMVNKVEGYRLRLDEKAAQHGHVVYLVDYEAPHCTTCGEYSVKLTECYYNGFYLYFCLAHLGHFTSAMKNMRGNK